jgi:hypothetical protein
MKCKNFSNHPVVQLTNLSSGHQTVTNQAHQRPEQPVQSGVLSPIAGLVALPLFALSLVLLFQGSRHLCFRAYNTLYAKYQNHRFQRQCRQIATLERIFSNSAPFKEQI